MYRYLLVFFYLLSNFSFASEKDSLLSVLDKGTYSEQAYTLLRLERVYRNNQPDSGLYYATKAYNLVVEKQLSDSILNSVYNNLAISYKNIGNYDTTLYFFNQSLKISKSLKDSTGMSTAFNNLGIYYEDIGKQSKALDNFIKSVQISSIINDRQGMALSYNNIGLIHYINEDFDKAKEYYIKSLRIRQELKDTNGMALLYNNIGILYYYEDEPQKCINYFKKAANIWGKANNLRSSAMVLSNIGELYYEIGIYQSALNYLNESQKMYSELGDLNGELYVLSILGGVYEELGKDKKAVKAYTNALEKAKKTGSNKDVYAINYDLYQLFYNNKNYKKAVFYLQEASISKDSIFSVEKERSMLEINTKYETEKKEKEIELLNNKDKLSKAELSKQRTINTSLIIGVFLILIVVGLFIRQNRIKHKANLELLHKNAEIEFQHAEISEQKDEIEAQRDLLHDQKDKIEVIHKHVSESISYAERIQKSTLPKIDLLKTNFSDSFLFYLPRDIVSGDFYWWGKIENSIVITAADSTGHGVPGAFMSMLGMSFLKEIVVNGYLTHPGVILRKMRKEIINTLKQKGEIGEQKDGMDMAMVSIDIKSNILLFAGANNPLYIITQSELEILNSKNKSAVRQLDTSSFSNSNPNLKFYEIKPDKMPIAIYENMNRFITHEIQLSKGDQVYMFSDGYADQFGGEKGKKLKYKNFKKLLLENAQLDMDKQQSLLNEFFFNWKANEEQVDDVLVLGVKI